MSDDGEVKEGTTKGKQKSRHLGIPIDFGGPIAMALVKSTMALSTSTRLLFLLFPYRTGINGLEFFFSQIMYVYID